MALFAAAYLLKVGSHFSRGMAFSLFVSGPAALILQQRLFARHLVSACRAGRLTVRRVFVVGDRRDIAEFRRTAERGSPGHTVVGQYALDGALAAGSETTLLARAVLRARRLTPDEILIALPLDQHARIQAAVEAFKALPAAIQLGADPLLRQYPGLRSLRTGDSARLELVREPLTALEQLAKRCFDIAVASTALVVMSPLLVATAIAIKLTSPGARLLSTGTPLLQPRYVPDYQIQDNVR